MHVSIKNFVKHIKFMQSSNNDVILGISGARGVGKSVLMMKMSEEFKGGLYDMEKYHIYKRKELIDDLENFPDREMLCVDEAITSLFKREFQKKSQINIIKMFNMYRDKSFLIFLLIPHFWDFDSSIRNSLIIKYWIYCFQRGEAVVFHADKNPGTFDPFDRKWIYRYWKSRQIHKAPNYVCNIRWSNVDEERYSLYKQIKARKRKLDNEDEKKEEIPITQIVKQMFKKNPNLNQAQLAKILNTSSAYVNKLICKERDDVLTNDL